MKEHDEDIPIKEEDIEDIEDDDYVDQEDLKPRNKFIIGLPQIRMFPNSTLIFSKLQYSISKWCIIY